MTDGLRTDQGEVTCRQRPSGTRQGRHRLWKQMEGDGEQVEPISDQGSHTTDTHR